MKIDYLSPYASKISFIRSIAGLLIGLGLGLGLTLPVMHNRSQLAEERYMALEDEAYSIQTQFYNEISENEDLKGIIADLNDKFKLFATLKENGWNARTPEEAHALLNELSQLPFGSPFHGGHKITAQYGVYSINKFGWTGVEHPGIDLIPLESDYNVYLPYDVTVINFGYSEVWGKNMLLETNSGYRIFIAHLSTIYWQDLDGDGKWSLSIGDRIPAGSRIAHIGMTGRYATGIHLHLEIRSPEPDGTYRTLDPEAIIGFTGEGGGQK